MSSPASSVAGCRSAPRPRRGGYDVVWKNGADQYVAWHTDSAGDYVATSTDVVSGNDISIQVLETLFDQDFNGDSTTGLSLTPIETQGATGLSVGAGRYFFETGGTPEATLKFEGADYVAGQFGDWADHGGRGGGGRRGALQRRPSPGMPTAGNYASPLFGGAGPRRHCARGVRPGSQRQRLHRLMRGCGRQNAAQTPASDCSTDSWRKRCL